MNKIQVVDGYKYSTKERSEEIFNTIKWNSQIFDKIFILCENEQYFNHYLFLQNDVIRVTNTTPPSFPKSVISYLAYLFPSILPSE